MVWARGSGPALGGWTGEAGGECPSSALTQRQRCCSSPELRTEQGPFDTRLVIWGAEQENAALRWCRGTPPSIATTQIQSRVTTEAPAEVSKCRKELLSVDEEGLSCLKQDGLKSKKDPVT